MDSETVAKEKKEQKKVDNAPQCLGMWSIQPGLIRTIKEILPTGKTILELGSGYGTSVLVEDYTVYSIEHNHRWLNRYHDNYIHAPLKEHKAVNHYDGTKWYDFEVLNRELPKIDYDLLLVDGPPYHRAGFIKYFSLFKRDVPIVFDDYNRPADRAIVIKIAHLLNKPYIVRGTDEYLSGHDKKLFAIINDPRVS